MARRKSHAAMILAALLLASATAAQERAGEATPTVMPGPAPDYSRPDHWLCRPDAMQHCSVNLDVTVVSADGRLRVDPWRPAALPPIDCFYVYPTSSQDPASNSDLVPGTKPWEEIPVVQNQFARFASVCRLFAPMYRSGTVAALIGQAPPADREMTFGDVAAAWAHYLEHDNQGRGVVLIGHSQGAFLLRELVMRRIEGTPDRQRLVSALLIGGAVSVPPGQDIGGDFETIPLCRREDQTGCLVAYNSRRADDPPPVNAVLGRAPEGLQEACVNPASLSGGSAPLDAYLQTRWVPAGGTPRPQKPWTRPEQPVTTSHVQVPGLLSGECQTDGRASWLAVTVNADPNDPRVDEIKGDMEPAGEPLSEWGLHMIDMDVAMGDLVHLVETQGRSWVAARR